MAQWESTCLACERPWVWYPAPQPPKNKSGSSQNQDRFYKTPCFSLHIKLECSDPLNEHWSTELAHQPVKAVMTVASHCPPGLLTPGKDLDVRVGEVCRGLYGILALMSPSECPWWGWRYCSAHAHNYPLIPRGWGREQTHSQCCRSAGSLQVSYCLQACPTMREPC